MELIRESLSSVSGSIGWAMAIAVVSSFIFAFTKMKSEDVEAKVQDLYERACEVAHGSWVVHSIHAGLNGGVLIILKKDRFPYLKEDLDIPPRHPDYDVFRTLQEGDYVGLAPEREIENHLPKDNLSTFLRYVRHIPAA
mgnify:CR=1 FL=1